MLLHARDRLRGREDRGVGIARLPDRQAKIVERVRGDECANRAELCEVIEDSRSDTTRGLTTTSPSLPPTASAFAMPGPNEYS